MGELAFSLGYPAIIYSKTNIQNAPSYTYVLEEPGQLGCKYDASALYAITWRLGSSKLFSSLHPTDENQVKFYNISKLLLVGPAVHRVFVNTKEIDFTYVAFAYIYCSSTKELFCLGLTVKDTPNDGIVLLPMYNVQKYRMQYLMNKWRRLTLIVGKWASFLTSLYTEVTYHPDNLGAKQTSEHFAMCAKL